jgi:hypothetical protein
VSVCDEKSDACKLLLESDLEKYAKAERSLRKNALEDCIFLLEKLGYSNFITQRSEDETTLVFEPYASKSSIEIQRLKSGRFTGILYALLGAIIFAIALVYLATEQLGMSLDITRIPSAEVAGNIVSWFSIGMDKNIYLGIGIFVSLFLAMMALIYAIRVHFKSNKNLVLAQEKLEEAQVYQESQGQCQWEMGEVDKHMQDTFETFMLYEIIFREQKTKLERILYVEGMKTQENEYHINSIKEMQDTKKLMEMIQDFMSIPMSEEGTLSEKSIIYLEQAKIEINKVIHRFYS